LEGEGSPNDDLFFKLMIRQPNFVDEAFVQETLKITKKKKPHVLPNKVKFEMIRDEFYNIFIAERSRF